MVEFLFVTWFLVGFGIRCKRWIQGSDPRRARLVEAQRDRERRTGRMPADGVPVHSASQRAEGTDADPVLPWPEA